MRVLNRLILVSLCLAVRALPAAAQDQGQAVIVAPLEGATVSGVVAILGTASHPKFVRYELAFGYSPNPTDTWFSVQEPVTTPIANNVLARWDTSGITDGVYALRLRVYWSEHQFIESFARNVRVQNATPAPPPATPAPSVPSAPAPSATPAIVLPPTSTPRPTAAVVSANAGSAPSAAAPSWLDWSTIGRALRDGLTVTAGLFALVGLYGVLKAALRHRPRR